MDVNTIDFLDEAMASKLDVQLHGDSISIVKNYGRDLKDVVQSKFGCKAEFYGVGSDMNPGNRKPAIVPEEKFSVKLPKGLKVSVWKADLTSFSVDAVVNAANENLQHYGGLANALSKAGGPEFQRASDEYIKRNGKLQTGEAIVTNACGALPCKKIIHAVGPYLSSYPTPAMVSQVEPKLKTAVLSILGQMEKHGLQSVAIPALSSGLFNFPLPRCADVIVSTLKEYHDKKYQSNSPLREVQLVNHDDPSVGEMQRACQTLASTTKSYSHAAGSHGKGASNASTTTVQVNNVTITLKRGRIEEQQTDVIVNTTSANLNLSEGQISKAIAQKAGYQMQTEINNQYKKSLQPPQVIPTKAYNLLCKEVYHTLCANKTNSSAPQILHDAILFCLHLAESKPHRSIAFPAIGTGNLGFRNVEVAKIMTDVMVDFACKKTQVNLDIVIVIFPDDYDTFKAFEAQLRSLQGMASNSSYSSSQGFEHRNISQAHASRPPSPQISLTSTSDEATQEAKHWLEHLLFHSFSPIVVHNNFLQYFGEQEFQQLHREAKLGVSIEEFFEKGCAGIMVKGESNEDVRVVALQVEAMLCKVQKDFVDEEKVGLMTPTSPKVSYERKPCEKSSRDFFRRDDEMCGLKVVRVDRVENRALKELFDLKQKQLQSTNPPRRMYQRIRVQFCDMVSQVGFQREYGPPDDPKYGDGIYFTGKVDEAMKVWKHLEEDKYLYFVEAQVLTGKSAPGAPGLIVPPIRDADPLCRYDSLDGGSDVSVIFNGHQALPEYIIICKK